MNRHFFDKTWVFSQKTQSFVTNPNDNLKNRYHF